MYGTMIATKARRHVRAYGANALRRFKPFLLLATPRSVLRLIQWRRGRTFTPPLGRVDFGDFRRLTPFNRKYGYDRGRPIDRYYIETFLERHGDDIKGRVLEIGDSTYTHQFGGDRVQKYDVLHAYKVPEATIVGDLADLSNVPADSFDCMIITQTLHLIYDVRKALENVYRVLKPGGVLLATFPGITQISDDEWRESWHWGFTSSSTKRLFHDVFPQTHLDISVRGNVLVSTAFLYGLADSELTSEELEFDDPDYHLVLTVRARKPELYETHAMEGRWDYSASNQFAYDADDSYRHGIAFLDGHGTVVEDWGCGTAYAKRFVEKSAYVGVDGSPSAFVDKVVDLQSYRSEVDCVFMRHVLEHNHGWRLILWNALASFRKRMVLIVFTPFAESERKIADNDGIPDLSLRRSDLMDMFVGLAVREEAIKSATQYGQEHIFFLERA
jgi:SAM-dependent methyltransferase